MSKPHLDVAKRDIVAFLKSTPGVYTLHELGVLLRENGESWRLPKRLSRGEFVEYLCEKKVLQAITLRFEDGTSVTRYGLRSEFNSVDLYLSLAKNAYLSHYTAMAFHQLTEQLPKIYYVNHELTPKKQSPGELSQESIDEAYAKPPRVSRKIAHYKKEKVVLLNSKYSNLLGVIPEALNNQAVRITNIERTLIDCAVKPEYAGGVYEVSKAFKTAKERASSNKMYAYLMELKYTYPFHQVLGFYMEQKEYHETIVGKLAKIPMKFDFYLAKGMSEVEYSKRWRLYYPKGLS